VGLLDNEYTAPVPILDSPGRRVSYQIQNDTVAEDFYAFDIRAYADGFFLVDSYSISSPTTRGWIAQKYVSVFARNYDAPLTLYADSRDDSRPRAVLPEWWNGLYAVVRCRGDWMYVRATIDGRLYEGWMPKAMQCGNPYTTCS
jgi:hypothetical protein